MTLPIFQTAGQRAEFSSPPEHETLLLDLGLPCPLDCLDCPRRSVRESPAALELAQQRLLEAARRTGVPALRAVLYGGDPFLAAPRVASLLAEVSAACAANEVSFEPFAISSGAAIGAEAARTLRNAGLRKVMVNLAGAREQHDRMRPLRRGRGGSFDRVVVGLRNLRGLPAVVRLTAAPDDPVVKAVSGLLEVAGVGAGEAPVALLVGPPAVYRDQARELLELVDHEKAQEQARERALENGLAHRPGQVAETAGPPPQRNGTSIGTSSR